MNRRDFSLQVAAAGLVLPAAVQAQGTPVEGQQFKTVAKERKPSFSSPAQKVEVIEFFWYGCGHCFAFEPALEAWAAQLPPDVAFRRVPYALLGAADHQRLFYALEQMGLLPSLHRKVFNAIHVDKRQLKDEAEITAFLSTQGVDAKKFGEAFKSFSMSARLSQGRQLATQFEIGSVPMLVVQGRYYTSPSMAGTADRALAVVNHLVQRARQGG